MEHAADTKRDPEMVDFWIDQDADLPLADILEVLYPEPSRYTEEVARG